MRALLRVCLRQRVLVLAISVLVMLLGLDATRHARIDAFPEFAPPRVEIQTEAPGLSSLEVEVLVTRPLEDALTGTPKVTALRSKSVLGLSSVVVLFAPGTDLYTARQLVQERVALAAPVLPVLAQAPVILSPTSSTSRVLKIGLSSTVRSRLDLSDLARWTIRPRLMAIPGVANVAIWGEARRELQIMVDPDRLRMLGLRVGDVARAGAAATNPSSGGFVDGPNQRLAVTQVARVTDAAGLADAPLASRGGVALRLGDAAEIVEDAAPPVGDAVIDGGAGLLLIVEKQPGGNSVAITEQIDAALAALAPALPDVVVDPTIFRPATFVERAIDNLEVSLGLGCALVVAILVVFLLDWRTAFISAMAIPLSLATAITILHHLGGTLDTMVLAGLSIALGEVVDDAIIDVENIHRRLGENALAAKPRRAFVVVLDASVEVRSAVVFASLIVALVFLPVYLLPGLAGAFFRPLAMAYVLAIASSLIVALTVTPALALVLLPNARRRRERTDRVWTERMVATVLRGVLAHPRVVLVLALGSLVAGTIGFTRLGTSFLPEFREHDFLMHWIAKPGTSVAALRRTTERVSQELLAVPGVRNAGAHLGRAEVSDEVVGPNFGEIWVSVDPDADHDATMRAIEAVLAPYPGIYHDVQTYLRERVDEVLTGGHGQVVVRISGPDLDVLRERAEAVAAELRQIAGVRDIAVEQASMVPQIEIRPRAQAAALYGMSDADIRTQVTDLVRGTRVGEVFRDLRPVAVRVWAAPALRGDVTALRELRLDAPDGAQVPLFEVADVTVAATPAGIKHEAGARRLDVSCRIGDADFGSVAAAIDAKVGAMTFAPGHHAEVLGEALAQRNASDSLLGGGLLAIAGILFVLYADFRALRPTLVVAVSLPFALVGSVVGVHLQGGVLSLGSLVGFVTVLGIAARNGIMLVSHYRRLESHDRVAPGRALVLRGTLERVTPILMTALATGLALVPLVALGERPGQEIEHPMAVVILAGLVTSTLLNLLVTPAVYLLFGGSAQADDDADAAGGEA